MKKLPWKKVVTREYPFFWASYALEAYKIMKQEVGTTLNYNLFYGNRKLLTVFRVESDIQNSYKMVEKIAETRPQEILKKIKVYELLVKEIYHLFKLIHQQKDKLVIKSLLKKLDQTFQLALCYYLFFVYLGYAANQPKIAKFVKKFGKKVKEIRNYKIDTDLIREYPNLYAKYNSNLKKLVPYMSKRELANALNDKKLNLAKIIPRRKSYLLIMEKFKIKEYAYSKITTILREKLTHQKENFSQKFITGQIACKGKVRGPVKVAFTLDDYKKIKPGTIVVTPMTKPLIVPYLRRVKGIVTNDGGALNHASIISRELNIPCIVGTINATNIFKDGDLVEVDADKGIVKKL